MSEWVKRKPCQGYGRLLVAVAMPTVLKILSLKSWLPDLEIVLGLHLLKHRWIRWLMMMLVWFFGCCFKSNFSLLSWSEFIFFYRDNCFSQCVAIVGSQFNFFNFPKSCLHLLSPKWQVIVAFRNKTFYLSRQLQFGFDSVFTTESVKTPPSLFGLS